ncbi:MAG: flagellar hook-basal body complex protein FliE [Acidobacteriaceae bacterium]|nr:flagellar hook-basal body complex protein FliE [Acidobacteriaceae bacterium]
MVPVQHIASTLASQATENSSSPSAQVGAPFSGVLHSVLQNMQSLESKASDAVTGLMNGSGVELHEAMIATQKADMSFELALQVRNKAVAAYQQMMNMQF